MNARRSIFFMGVLLILSSALVALIFTVIGFQSSVLREKERLTLLLNTNIQLLSEFIAARSGTQRAARPGMLEQHLKAKIRSISFGESGEFMLGRYEAGNIVFLTDLRKRAGSVNPVIAQFEKKSSPMRNALAGNSGLTEGIDYEAHAVLAAFAPVPGTAWGAVAKIDLEEIRRPYLRSGLMSAGISAIVIACATIIFGALGSPLLGRLKSLGRAVDQGAGFVIITDFSGIIEYVNPKFLETTGYARDEIIGKKPAILKTGNTSADLYHDLWQTIRAGREWRGEFLNKKKNGETFWVAASISPIRNDFGKIVNFIGIQEDITHLKAVHEELKRSNRDLEQFAYVVSHDLNEPLRTIGGFLNLLRKHYAAQLDSRAGEFMDFAVGGVNRLQSLIEQILKYSRVAGTGLRIQNVSMEEILAEVAVSLKILIEESETRLLWENLPTVRADRTQITQLLQNLITNAVKFRGSASPIVHIQSIRGANHWVFCVKDNGIGFDSRQQENVFIIFRRLSTSPDTPGTGIGLALCRKIVEKHGGKIWAESKPGEGAAFYFTLPDLPRGSQEHADQAG